MQSTVRDTVIWAFEIKTTLSDHFLELGLVADDVLIVDWLG